MSAGIPLIFGPTGPIATPPATLQAALTALVETIAQPGYTNTLPGSLIEDVSSTDVGALIVVDQFRVDTLNNLSPYAANAYILAQLGVQFGLPINLPTNGNAFVVVGGAVGYVVPPGWLVSDGTNQYTVQDGGTVGTGGVSQPLFVVCTNNSIFPIPPGSITTIVTAVPSPYALTVTNPTAGIPAGLAETTASYRSRILQAYQVATTGTPAYLKTLLYALPGVTQRLVSIRQAGQYWIVICGGGDPYQTAGAIYQGVSSIGLLTGSQISSGRNITVSIFDAPDSYSVTYVNPPQQTLAFSILWNTTLPNFTSQAQVNQYIIAAATAYGNSIGVGQPVNLIVLQQQIGAALASIIPPYALSTLVITTIINGVTTPPTAGTSLVPSDPESYFQVSATGVTSAQG